MSDTATIIVLRHGEPESNNTSEKIFRGITDDPLTKQGWRQMTTAFESLNDIDYMFTSPLKRCSEFAHQIANKHRLPIQTIDALQEINFGQWDGQPVQKIADDYPEQLKLFWENPSDYTPPDGEPVLDFQKRVTTFWNTLLPAQKGKSCLLVAHGGVQKMILAQVLKMPVEAIHGIEVPYACCSTFQVYYTGTEIITTLKSHIHLQDDE
ncbi:MAG: alpha-ribazole phosphatase family protein [Gammaproteobacteria bacterium]|nr:alpha-ribazole phosphatase family protein [Gammaproteobacteria bacterium]